MATRGKKAQKRVGASKKKRGTAVKKRGGVRAAAAAKRPKRSAASQRAKRTTVSATTVTAKKNGVVTAPKVSPIGRVTRVAKEVAQQATTAVSEGVGALKEFGESIVERVTG